MVTRLKIIHVTPNYTPVIGGVKEVARRIAEYMVNKGNDVYVVTYNRDENGRLFLPKCEVINGVHVIRLTPKFLWSHGSFSSEVPKVISQLKPDIVHVHGWRHPHCFQIARLHRRMRFKLILHPHSPFHNRCQLGTVIWIYHRTADALMKRSLNEYDRIVALTPFEKNMFEKRLRVDSRKIVVIPNGISDDLFRLRDKFKDKTDKTKTVFYLGRINKEKNLGLLVKSMYWVEKKVHAKLLLVGPDEGYVSYLQNYCKRNNVCLEYHGPIHTDLEKAKLFGSCTLFASPSLFEGLPLTLLEAQAFGKPCVITGNGGQLYAAPPGISSKYALPDPKDYAASLITLLTNNGLYDRLSENAKTLASSYLWSDILPRFWILYKALLAESIQRTDVNYSE